MSVPELSTLRSKESFDKAVSNAQSTRADFGDQLDKYIASDAASSDRFGTSVSLSGSTALIGATGNDDVGNSSGSAYLVDVTTGQELFKLTASDAAANDLFGISASLSGNTALVGANQNDDAGNVSGSAYLFDATTGLELFKLMASDAAEGDHFGRSVAVSGNTAIVGSPLDDDGGSSSGSAYLFDVTTGQELYKLTASDAAGGEEFGLSVAISGNTAIVGAYQDHDAGNESGSAYLFDITTGQELFKLTASDAAAGDWFGISVAISGNTALVGSRFDDDGGGSSGSAYMFDVSTGQELYKLTASDAASDDSFGVSVALNDSIALVGATLDDDAGSLSGSAYLFDIATGQELLKLTASDAAKGDRFGGSLSLSDNFALVGATHDDDDGPSSGSAYMFDIRVPEPTGATLLFIASISMGVCRRRVISKYRRGSI